MFRNVCDPSSGSIELYLTEIRSGLLMFVLCLIGVSQRNFKPVGCVCVCMVRRAGNIKTEHILKRKKKKEKEKATAEQFLRSGTEVWLLMAIVLDKIGMYKLEAELQTSKNIHFPTHSSFDCTSQA